MVLRMVKVRVPMTTEITPQNRPKKMMWPMSHIHSQANGSMSSASLLVVQFRLLREDRQVAVGQHVDQQPEAQHQRGDAPLLPGGQVGIELLKGQHRQGQRLDGEYEAVQGHPGAGHDHGQEQQAVALAHLLLQQHQGRHPAEEPQLEPHQPVAVGVVVHVVHGQAHGRQLDQGPPGGVGALGHHVGHQQPAADLAHEHLHVVLGQLAAGDLLGEHHDHGGEAGPGGDGAPDEQEEGPGPDAQAAAGREGPGVEHPEHAAQGALVEEAQEGARRGEHDHDGVQVVAEGAELGHPADALVVQHGGQQLDAQHDGVGGDAEHHLGEHGVHVGVPEAEPPADGLADVDAQHQNGAHVADEADEHRRVDDGFQLGLAHDVVQKAGEKSAGSQGDNRQVHHDPHAKGEVVVHVGLVEPQHQAQCRADREIGQQGQRQAQPEQEYLGPTALDALGVPAFVVGVLGQIVKPSSHCCPRLCQWPPPAAAWANFLWRVTQLSAILRTHSRLDMQQTLGSVCSFSSRRKVCSLEMSLCTLCSGLFSCPKVMAPEGQASVQAVWQSISPTSLPSTRALFRARCQRWQQKVHFSTTPRMRGLTKGLRPRGVPLGQGTSYQLKQRAWQGQAATQYRQPMQRVGIWLTMPVAMSQSVAVAGHTLTQGG
eukprot:TRINITY_DN12345_c0_g2_i1.p2 TRINITY_DN12345_c0_g2~~TRINITY_DN12345_c0_g2_i1.p2  ORF type:complete len:654 (-),score=172.14 TRINITY_DN12345_c0_g2_i1:394-2355(-)